MARESSEIKDLVNILTENMIAAGCNCFEYGSVSDRE